MMIDDLTRDDGMIDGVFFFMSSLRDMVGRNLAFCWAFVNCTLLYGTRDMVILF